jgi:aspartate ammonia-lyase
MIPEGALYGISTARCLDAYSQMGPSFPDSIVFWLLRIRSAQAIAFLEDGSIEPALLAAYSSAVKRILSDSALLEEQVCVRPVNDVSGRILVRNIDEVLFNLTLLELGYPLGEYHRVAPLAVLSVGHAPVEIFQLAVRIELNELLASFSSDLSELNNQLLKAGEEEHEVARLVSLQMHSVAIRASSLFWLEFSGTVQSSLDQIQSLIDVPILTNLSRRSIGVLRREISAKSSLSETAEQLISVYDFLTRVANEVTSISGRLIQFANFARMRIDCHNDASWPQLNSSDPLNPKLNEPTIADIIFQETVLVQTAIDRISRLRYSSFGEIDSFVPLAAVELINAISMLGATCRKLADDWLKGMTFDSNAVQNRLRASPLKADVLIPLLGLERAVQVAKMSALTGRPVSSVVEKMKLLSPEQLRALFPEDDSRDIER